MITSKPDIDRVIKGIVAAVIFLHICFEHELEIMRIQEVIDNAEV